MMMTAPEVPCEPVVWEGRHDVLVPLWVWEWERQKKRATVERWLEGLED
jgi:hypothetical protein